MANNRDAEADDIIEQAVRANVRASAARLRHASDILTGLETGLIESYPTPPLAALSLQWFRETPYMTSIGFAPLVGAVIVAKR